MKELGDHRQQSSDFMKEKDLNDFIRKKDEMPREVYLHGEKDMTRKDEYEPDDPPMHASDRLKAYSDEQLQGELDRRKKEREEKATADRKAREVRVECLTCKGKGTTTERCPASAMEYDVTCYMCKGDRVITALRA